jgi:small subunit ribosomal protein S2
MERLPNAVYVIDSNVEQTAVREANRLSIPVVGLLDTNCNPDNIDYVIPGNDDAIRSIKLITALVVEAVLEGKRKFAEGKAAEAEAAAAKQAATEKQVAGESELVEIAETEEEKEKEKEEKVVRRKRKIK